MPHSTLPWWRPDRFARKKQFLQTRQLVLRATRRYFENEGFAEVETPILQISPGNEVHLHAFRSTYRDLNSGEHREYHLHTSPELAMKKLLVAGMPKIFQLAHTFRNGERSARHHPEFSMLEWYRTDARLNIIQDDCITLVRLAAESAGIKQFSAQGMRCDPYLEWEILSVPEAFDRYTGIDLMSIIGDVTKLATAMQKAGLRATVEDTWDDLFFRAMGEKIEPFLGKDRPTFLCDYPVSMAALARPKREDARLAERFELYICGYELANAFDELTDVTEQERRFQADMDMKEKIYGHRYPIDADFMAALTHGMPESSGVALGFDRLVMLCAGTDDIEDVLWAPVA